MLVDSGRQKCGNYLAGRVSYDIMWISKTATGPVHCCRLCFSSVYSRHLDEFALPEVVTKPLEDVVLAMKAMDVSNVTLFPFTTPPGLGQFTSKSSIRCWSVERIVQRLKNVLPAIALSDVGAWREEYNDERMDQETCKCRL